MSGSVDRQGDVTIGPMVAQDDADLPGRATSTATYRYPVLYPVKLAG
jgi:hypothetical protein